MAIEITLTINGRRKILQAEPGESLLKLLRKAGYVEVKTGCEAGDCGSCLVLLDGRPVNSCMVLAPSVDGAEVTTVRGVGTQRAPHPIQIALVEAGGVQCGYCTPGIVIAAYALLRSNPTPSEREIREALDGNLCRCTGYEKIIAGVRLAAARMQEEGHHA